MSEIESWAGHPSQWTNAATFAGCVFLITLLIALGIHFPSRATSMLAFSFAALIALRALVAYLKVRCWSYALTDQRFKYSFGILSRRFHEVELYRIKDAVLDQPFWLRILGLSNITIVGFDAVRPIVHIRAVRDGAQVRESFRSLVEARRDKKSVRVSENG